jgi:hypothetical protein
MIDLGIHDQDCSNRGVANGARGLKLGACLQLGAEIGRCIDEEPIRTAIRDSERGLRSSNGLDRSGA